MQRKAEWATRCKPMRGWGPLEGLVVLVVELLVTKSGVRCTKSLYKGVCPHQSSPKASQRWGQCSVATAPSFIRHMQDGWR